MHIFFLRTQKFRNTEQIKLWNFLMGKRLMDHPVPVSQARYGYPVLFAQFVDHCCNAWRLHCDKKRRKSSSSSAAIISRLRMNINGLLRKLL